MFQDERGRRVIRLGDTTSHGGKVITGADMWNVFGKPVARVGDKVICPKCDNKVYEIIEGNQKMNAFGRPVAFDGHRTSCGATLISSLEPVSYSPNSISQTSSMSNDAYGSGDTRSRSISSNSGNREEDKFLSHYRKFKLLNHHGEPLSDIPYKIKSLDSGEEIEGRTNASGMTDDFKTASREHVVFYIVAAGELYEGARDKTILIHNNYVTDVKVKIYWIHENLWDDSWIAKYRSMVEDISYALKNTSQRVLHGFLRPAIYSCEDFALSIFVNFAYMHKLPIFLETGAAKFMNIDFNFTSPYKKSNSDRDGFLLDLLTAYGARDTLKNCIHLNSKTDAKTGDLFLRNDKGHVQVVMNNQPGFIEIKQGNFPTGASEVTWNYVGGKLQSLGSRNYGMNSPMSNYYMGAAIQDGIYEKLNNGSWSYKNLTLGTGDSGKTWVLMSDAYQWDFEKCNQY